MRPIIIMLAIVIALIFFKCYPRVEEDFDTVSNEAIQTISSVYNSNNMTLTNLNATGNITAKGKVVVDKRGSDWAGNIELYGGQKEMPYISWFDKSGTKITHDMGNYRNGDLTLDGNLASKSLSTKSIDINLGGDWGSPITLHGGNKEPGWIKWLNSTGAQTALDMGNYRVGDLRLDGIVKEKAVYVTNVPWDQRKMTSYIRDGRFFTRDMPDGMIIKFLFMANDSNNMRYVHAVKYGGDKFMVTNMSPDHGNRDSLDDNWRLQILP